MSKFETEVQVIKYKVLKEVAKDGWRGKLPYSTFSIPERVTSGLESSIRCCVHKEKEIVKHRIKLALGGTHENQNKIEVIGIACDECPSGGYTVTDGCRGCLAHNCVKACKKDAIWFDEHHFAHIDKSKCVECGACAKACHFQAIQLRKRPCENACKIGAISMNPDYTCKIDDDKCIRCGACMVQCPFGAIMDKSYMVNVIDLIQKSDNNQKYRVNAVIAPAIASQFPEVSMGKLVAGIKKIGFAEVYEAALGADMVSKAESKELVEKGFLTSSCCPAFVMYIKKNYPDLVQYISHNLSPQATISKYLKEQDPTCKNIFIGPCTAKKAEIDLPEVSPYVDEVLTFEELQALIDSLEIDLTSLEDEPINDATYFGRIFARSGGLSEAVVEALAEQNITDFELKAIACSGIEECKMALIKKQHNALPENFIEGMACVGGCINGAGCIIHGDRNKIAVDKFSSLNKAMKIIDYPSKLSKSENE